MSCDSCGHPRMAHKEATMSVYFCNQCHVVQTDAPLPVDNTFEDVYDIVMREQTGARKEQKPQKIDEITP